MTGFLRFGYVTGPVIGFLWAVTMAVCVAIAFALATGAAAKPALLAAGMAGGVTGLALVMRARLPVMNRWIAGLISLIVVFALGFGQPFSLALGEAQPLHLLAILGFGAATALPLGVMLADIPEGALDKHEFEGAVIKFLTGWGYVFFTAIVAIPFYVMVMTSVKSQQSLLANPLDYSLDWEKGWGLFRSYVELFRDFGFGNYLLTSAFVSVATVIITLIFSVPGAYAVARLRFRGRAYMSRSILLIYMVPMIVLALPIYIAFSMAGLRNSILGILLIYPVTTIPVALYMLQGYFRGLPAEVEEAGLMDGLSRLAVIWKITLPLSLPALASVSLYVFMIAWNEFLLAFMLLDDPSKFTLTRGVAMLNSSEIPRQHLMAGSVIATVPIMLIFLGLERFMTKGLTAGSVKG